MPKPTLLAAAAIAAGLVIFCLVVMLRTPRTDRHWESGLSRSPVFKAMEEGNWRLHDMRAFDFSAADGPIQAWRDETLHTDDLEEIWFFVEPFEGFHGAAHTLISFVFGGETDQTIAISVEARKEQGETYSGLNGMFNKFELIYLWSSEKDVLTRIAVNLDHEIYAYRLNVTQSQAQQILAHFIDRTNALAERPRFYNTLTSNCTNELAKAVNSAFPGALPWHYAHVFTGYSAERLHALGFLGEGTNKLQDLKSNAAAGDAMRAAANAPEAQFPSRWREFMAAHERETR